MFNKKKWKKSTHLDTLIGQHTHINGDINFSGGLRIDGKVIGNINADDEKSVLTLSEHGHIEGNINVANIIINGTVAGEVYSSGHLELAAKAHVHGNVHYHLLEMMVGSEVNGQLIHQQEPPLPQLGHEPNNDVNTP